MDNHGWKSTPFNHGWMGTEPRCVASGESLQEASHEKNTDWSSVSETTRKESVPKDTQGSDGTHSLTDPSTSQNIGEGGWQQ